MQFTMELPAVRALETKCIQESVMTKPCHDRLFYLLTLYSNFLYGCKRHYCMCTIHYIELPFSKFYLLYFVFLCYKSILHPKVFLTHFLMSRLNCMTSTFRKQKQHHMSLFTNFYSRVNQGAVSKSMSSAV